MDRRDFLQLAVVGPIIRSLPRKKGRNFKVHHFDWIAKGKVQRMETVELKGEKLWFLSAEKEGPDSEFRMVIGRRVIKGQMEWLLWIKRSALRLNETEALARNKRFRGR